MRRFESVPFLLQGLVTSLLVAGPQTAWSQEQRPIQVTPEGRGSGKAMHRGMTWKVLQQEGDHVHVGNDSASNAYHGDTHPDTVLPVLCLKKDGQAAPKGITIDFYNGWTGGEVRLSKPVSGYSLTSREAADALCAESFGKGFRMAEFHDGNGGWTWWARGRLSARSRFWVAINDQPANPWDEAAGR